jgi:pimeloyl-ACP methyl ester carboxylesterase
MSKRNGGAAMVLVHGAWHGAWCYERVIPLLAGHGVYALARDLPAHGLNARFPASFGVRPLAPAAFGGEPSPLAQVTLDDYVAGVVDTIDQMKALGHEKVVLVGHSMGGVPITAVAERVPEKLSALVYLTAFMPGSGVPAVAYIAAPENAGEMVGPQFMADPQQVGALRIDHRSADPAYRDRTRAAFFGDVGDAEFEAALHLLTPDVPVAPFATPVATTADRWGAVPRHYIRCHRDQAIRPALQARFIAEADALVPARPTVVHELDASHSPFLSQPAALAALLAKIALG